jgi:hypothetical protein
MFSLGGGFILSEEKKKKKTLWKNNPVLLFQKIINGFYIWPFFLLLFVPLTKKGYTMDRNALLVLSFCLPCHTPDLTNLFRNPLAPMCKPFCYGMCWVQTILLWNVLGTSHSVMECAGYKPFCYGVWWVPKRPHSKR